MSIFKYFSNVIIKIYNKPIILILGLKMADSEENLGGSRGKVQD